MQEPIDHTEQQDNSMFPDYRPDDGALYLFRRMGRLGKAISLISAVVMAYEIYIASTYYLLMNGRFEGYFAIHETRLREEYAMRFFCLSLLSLIGIFSIILLFRASRSLLQYGSDHNNMDIGRPARHLQSWFICLLVNVIVNVIYIAYLFIRSQNDMMR